MAGGGGARSPSDGGLVRVEPVEPPGQLGASAVLQRVGALLDLIDLLALDLGPPPFTWNRPNLEARSVVVIVVLVAVVVVRLSGCVSFSSSVRVP